MGLRAIYKGKEYFAYDKKEYFEILTFEEEEGFVLYCTDKNGNTYKKNVNRCEITEAYEITTYAIYKGFNCFILGGKDKYHRTIDMLNSIEPMSEEMEIEKAKELGFHQWDRNGYMKNNVPIEELEIYEVRKEHKI